ncbi:MAG: Mur ligase family protein [Candidatus Saccharimonadales bacterium]
MKRYLNFFTLKLPIYLVYMYQQVEYNPHKFVRWVWRIPDIRKVMHRQSVVWTPKARLLVAIIGFFWVFYIVSTIIYLIFMPISGILTALLSPFLVTLISYLVVLAAWLYIEEPRRSALIKRATKLFEQHPGTKIAISGSYGKTTMKELLNTVLSEGRTVAATPGNKNVPVSHAAWIKRLTGSEDILLIEYGEGAPGDIRKLARLTQPKYGIITGLASNHLDEYKTLNAVAKDLLSLKDYVDDHRLFINTEAPAFAAYDLAGTTSYSADGVLGWATSGVKVEYSGTSFVMKKAKKTINVKSGLLGAHQVGPLALSAALADRLGLSIAQIEAGLAKTTPFEHRMQARRQHGAWIIDDTYNGSLEGIRAGLALLAALPAKRKIYVTPGLVDQGEETERVHLEVGELIGGANPDRVVLMQNSTTQWIIKGLEASEYQGDLHIEADPLTYYTNLEHVLAAGDLIVLQNDWTDNYA